MRLEARTSEGPAGTTELVTFSRPRVVSTLAALQGRGWRDGGAVTAISDGDPALQALVRSATGSLVKFILDWFQLSMRVHHVEQAMRGLCALQPPPLVPLDRVQIDIERLRAPALERLSRQGVRGSGPDRKLGHCRPASTGTEDALIGYGKRYRAGKPIPTSRATGAVDQMVSARMNKPRPMRWSPYGAQRVLQVRAAVLDGQFGHPALQLAA